jgi:hypothetical protein
VNYTREPIIETIITPKEGCKLVVRNSRGAGQEEYFVDALEVVSFGSALFFRSLERPKAFLVPVTDYEVVEVRETRMVLKTAPIERGIKIGGGRESTTKVAKEPPVERPVLDDEEATGTEDLAGTSADGKEIRPEKKRERRRNRRRRGGREEGKTPGRLPEEESGSSAMEESDLLPTPYAEESTNSVQEKVQPVFTALLPPPATLISETISRYRGHPDYKKAFFTPTEEEVEGSEEEQVSSSLFTEVTPQPSYPATTQEDEEISSVFHEDEDE